MYFYITILFLYCFTFNVTAQANELFKYLPTSVTKQPQTQALRNKAIYPIRVNRSLSALSTGDRLDLPLLNGSSLSMRIDKKWSTPNGDVQFISHFEGDGLAVITFGKDSVFANFSNKQHNYGIGLDENRQPFLIDHNASANTVDLGDDMRFPEGTPFKIPGNSSAQQSTANATANNKSVVTLLILYSQEFAKGFVNPLTRINQMIAFTNAAYVRTGIHIELQLAHARQISFNNDTDIGTLLDQVTNGTNAFSGAPALRTQYFADMVAVLPFSSGGSVSGVAWVNGDREQYSYSVTQFAIWGSDSVFAHELGHNLGSGHERRSANPSQSSPCSGGYTGYSCGHGNGSEGTIMSYLNDAAWNSVFSNPDLDCNGEPCGIAKGQSNAADNKSSFNITGPLVEDFRVDTTNDEQVDKIGVYRPSNRRFYLDSDGSLSWNAGDQITAPFGLSGDKPIRGDWNGDGIDEISVYRPSNRRFYLDFNGSGNWDAGNDVVSTPFGSNGDLPIVGDWSGDGVDEIGVYRPSNRRFYFDIDNSYSWNTGDSFSASFGISGDIPIVGDWSGLGSDLIGVYRPFNRRFYLDFNGNDNWNTSDDVVSTPFGSRGDLPVVGDWHSDGTDQIGVYRPSNRRFYLDINGSNSWNVGDLFSAPFGKIGDLPVTE